MTRISQKTQLSFTLRGLKVHVNKALYSSEYLKSISCLDIFSICKLFLWTTKQNLTLYFSNRLSQTLNVIKFCLISILPYSKVTVTRWRNTRIQAPCIENPGRFSSLNIVQTSLPGPAVFNIVQPLEPRANCFWHRSYFPILGQSFILKVC